ncbi:hypothetical protein, partial [Hydrogenophaga sp.]|uniref:hypothetical protein n=1 Tax=Hydrogenophaga sp. TaxID=1904254 RepID=UPI003D0A592A
MPSPLLPGPWRMLDADNSRALRARLAEALAAHGAAATFPIDRPIGALRALPLSFYPGWLLIEGDAQLDGRLVGTFDLLFGPGFLWPLDRSSSVIHDINGGMVRIADDAAAGSGPRFLPTPLGALDAVRTGPDYLRFFWVLVPNPGKSSGSTAAAANLLLPHSKHAGGRPWPQSILWPGSA